MSKTIVRRNAAKAADYDRLAERVKNLATTLDKERTEARDRFDHEVSLWQESLKRANERIADLEAANRGLREENQRLYESDKAKRAIYRAMGIQ